MLIVATVNTRHYLIIISRRWDMMMREETLEEGLLAGETLVRALLCSEPLCMDWSRRKNAKRTRRRRRVGDSLA